MESFSISVTRALLFQLENIDAIPGINPNIQLTLDEDGNIVFNPDQWPNGFARRNWWGRRYFSGSNGNQKTRGQRGQLRRAHAPSV